eukprot:gnl/MRDRNA2_/MRDRNA2_65708_c0_seq2.p1 gnl/MRDRNA2_/MRDRNA2_65708_c0~~gnl/MRDRNA2_/MRDRNA2_65708_c0_seq2.p1  ORF type:complete len:262 (+),score=30.74 gnl/MRDRNA2_/MRDRNA2_65708_c0_seq2:34-819(+)
MLHDVVTGTDGWAHNEDYPRTFYDTVYFVRQRILSADGSKAYDFAAFTYPGVLPGFSASWNSYGLGFTWNKLFPLPINEGPGVAVAFVLRDTLRAKSISEAFEIASPSDLWLGMNMNVGDFHARHMSTVEIAPGGRKDILNIGDSGAVFHANEYLRLEDVRQVPNVFVSSRQRKAAFERLEAWNASHEIADLLKILGDTNDTAYPIFHRNDATGSKTMFTVSFDLHARTISVYRDNPHLGDQAKLWTENISEGAWPVPVYV